MRFVFSIQKVIAKKAFCDIFFKQFISLNIKILKLIKKISKYLFNHAFKYPKYSSADSGSVKLFPVFTPVCLNLKKR